MNHNKLKKIIPLIAVFVLSIISCDKNIERDEAFISVSYADESFFKKYQTYDSFIDDNEYAHKIAFIPNVPVNNFSWLSVGIDFDNDGFIYKIENELYKVNELHPQKPLVVSWVEVGMMSAFAFSYRDKDGQKKYFLGQAGNYGGDSEEYDGPAFIINEWFPWVAATGIYQYTDDDVMLTLDLSQNSYILKLNDVVYTGAAVIDFKNIDDNYSYSWNVTLKGIKWAAWDNKIVNSPSDISLRLIDDNELVFQNHGDAEFRYMIFNELYNGDNWVSLTKLQTQKLISTVTFNNKKIPMTVYYTRDADGEYFMNVLDFVYEGKNHSINLDGLETFPFEDPDKFDLVGVADYNFDNYMDITILAGQSAKGSWEQIFIYNPQKKNYYRHEELSEMPYIWIDNDTKSIRMHGNNGHAGLLYTTEEYKWVKGQLTLIYRANQTYDEELEKYVLTIKTLKNGAWEEETEMFKEEDLQN